MPYFVTDDNNRIYYEERGRGEPLVFIHGWTCSRRFFKHQVPEFSKKYRVITLICEAMAIRTGRSERKRGCRSVALRRIYIS